jgi:DNA-binding transcriptional ArsR family regulator
VSRDTSRIRDLLELDRVIHEPARLAILTILSAADEVEFKFLEQMIGLTRGNLSSHMSKLEAASYVVVLKSYRERVPVTSYRITAAGREALDRYRRQLLDGIRGR